MASDECIARILMEIADAYPSFEFTPERVKVWQKYLKDYEDDLLTAALEFYISTSDKAFAPAIPEIRSAATQLKIQIAGIPTSLEAWEDVLKAHPPRRILSGQIDPESGLEMIQDDVYIFIHPIVEKVAVMLGWPGKFPVSDEVSVDRAHFVKAYDMAISKASVLDRQIPEIKQFVQVQRSLDVPMLDVDTDARMKKLTARMEQKK